MTQASSLSVSSLATQLPMIVLEGSPEARAWSLLRVFGAEVARGRHFFTHLVSNFARQGMPTLPEAVLSRLDRTAYRLFGRVMGRRFSPDTLRLFAAIAQEDPSLGPIEDLLHSHMSLDLLFMTAMFAQKLHLSLPSPAACSCFAAWGDASVNGKLYVGRNFDFPAYRTDAPPSWLVLERPQGAIDHVSVYHAPGYLPGITSINREGLILGVLMNFAKKVTPFGAPVLAISKAVIEGARTVDDARAILRRMPPAAGWTFFVAETNKRRAMVFESSAAGFGEVEPKRSVLFSANRYRSATLMGTDAPPTHAFYEHNIAREARLRDLARQHYGSLDAARVAAILGDTTDPSTSSYRSLGPVISTSYNTGSVVFAPEDDSLLVAVGGWPSNCAGTYAALSLSALFQGRVLQTGTLPPNRSGDSRQGIVAYLQATTHLLDNDANAALEALTRAVTHEPHEATFRTARAILLLRRGQAVEAQQDLDAALQHETWATRRAFAELLRGHALDLQLSREAAKASYQKALCNPEKKVTTSAKKFLKRPFSQRDANALGFDPMLVAPA